MIGIALLFLVVWLGLNALWFGVGWWAEYRAPKQRRRPHLYVVRS